MALLNRLKRSTQQILSENKRMRRIVLSKKTAEGRAARSEHAGAMRSLKKKMGGDGFRDHIRKWAKFSADLRKNSR